MRRYTQNIEECEHCGKVFESGEDYWKDARNKCYCVDNSCGWEDDDTSDSNCTIHGVSTVCPACYGSGVVPGDINGCYHCAGTGKQTDR